jgi:hypothetical protein
MQFQLDGTRSPIGNQTYQKWKCEAHRFVNLSVPIIGVNWKMQSDGMDRPSWIMSLREGPPSIPCGEKMQKMMNFNLKTSTVLVIDNIMHRLEIEKKQTNSSEARIF